MKRRSKASGAPLKRRRRKAPEPERRNGPKTASPATQKTEAARLTRENAGLLSELREYLQQRTATAEVLSIISRSTFDLAKVLNTVLELGARLSKADKGAILRAAGNTSYYAAATYRHTPEFIESQKGILFAPGRSGVVGRVLLEGKSVQVADVFDDPEYAYREFARLGGFRTILGVPLLRDGSVIGLFVLHRAAVRPFTENRSSWSRLRQSSRHRHRERTALNELRQRTSDLTEVAGATDGNIGGAPRYQQLSRRSGARVCDDAGERHPHLRGQWLYPSLGGRRRSPHATHNAPSAYGGQRRGPPYYLPVRTIFWSSGLQDGGPNR